MADDADDASESLPSLPRDAVGRDAVGQPAVGLDAVGLKSPHQKTAESAIPGTASVINASVSPAEAAPENGGETDAEPSSAPEQKNRVSRSGSIGRHRVRNAIETMILSGQLRPNQRLHQLGLAKQFGVAQSVVRESLLELQISGLIRSVDNAGMFVSDMSVHRLIHAYQIREVFEGLAARLCCSQATRAEIRQMYALADANREFGAANDLVRRSESDRDFHYRIIVASRNEILAQLTDSYRALGMVVRTERPLDTVYEEHRAIVRAIEGKAVVKAERLAREHAHAALEVIESQIRQGTFSPNWVMPST